MATGSGPTPMLTAWRTVPVDGTTQPGRPAPTTSRAHTSPCLFGQGAIIQLRAPHSTEPGMRHHAWRHDACLLPNQARRGSPGSRHWGADERLGGACDPRLRRLRAPHLDRYEVRRKRGEPYEEALELLSGDEPDASSWGVELLRALGAALARSASSWPPAELRDSQRRRVELLERLPVAGRGGLVVGRVVGHGEAVRRRVGDAACGRRPPPSAPPTAARTARRRTRRRSRRPPRRPSPSWPRRAGGGCPARCWRSGRRGTTPPRRPGRGSARRR